jgi:RNA polymerase-associated protein
MAIVTKRTVMTLHTDLSDVYSHQVRIVLAEKGVNAEIISTDPNHPSEDLLSLNPYGSVPTLLDRDLVLFEARIIMEYLDERFPHPPLLPVYPVSRAESRKMMYRIERDWYQLMQAILADNNAEDARTELKNSLMSLEPVFADKPYFLSEDFSLLDCTMAPLLWRLPLLNIEIDSSAKGLHAYMQRLFQRESFKVSLTEVEKQMRVA